MDTVFCHICGVWVNAIDKQIKDENLPFCPECNKVLWEQMCINHRNHEKGDNNVSKEKNMYTE